MLPDAIIGVYAKPFERLRRNSWTNSASISNSQTPGWIKFKTRRNPFSVISHACWINWISSVSFTERIRCKIGLERK